MNYKITADSTCDLSPQQIQENEIEIFPLFINMGGKSYLDGIDIDPTQIFAHVAAGGDLCTTAAVPVGVYRDRFTELAREYDAVIHVSLGSGFSAAYQNACLAAENLKNVYVVDSRNLSTGHGAAVIAACMRSKTEEDPEALVRYLNEFTPRVDTSFLLDRLDYMVKGGRCSSVVALGANLLKLKPCIEVINNKMVVGKKYRGNYAKCMERYVRDHLAHMEELCDDFIFITHTPVSQEVHETVHRTVRECGSFRNIWDTCAGCTISCHCGEGCLGILYVHKNPKGKK